jgi:phosphatidylinositol dimannoside acyltransferase
VKPREILSWKFLFYHALLPTLRRLGPERADAALTGLGRTLTALWPPHHRRLARALAGHERLPIDPDTVVPSLAEGIVRFRARDYLLDTDDDREALARFDVTGAEGFASALATGRGAVLVGSHLGGHIATFHWLYRQGVPLRLMVQRPRHVTPALNRFFDRAEPEPQSGFFLRRSLEPAACVARVVRARAALRAGKVVYLPGDIPWTGPNTHTGRLLGRAIRVLSVWADLAALTGAPVFHVFCTHVAGGRFALGLEPAGRIAPGEEGAAVARYLARLEAEIAAHPGDAVAHLLWPCYGPPRPELSPTPRAEPRPSRRIAAATHF